MPYSFLRTPRILLCGLLLILPGMATAQDKPENFSARLAIQTPGNAPYYRVTLPIEAYQGSAFGDLRDLRVFNAQGIAVPHTRLAIDGEMATQTQKTTLHWFPLYAGTTTTTGNDTPQPEQAFNVVVRQDKDGSLVEIHGNIRPHANTGSAPAHKEEALRGYLLDASRIDSPESVRSLELDWSGTAANFQLVDLESSNDLQHWHTLRSDIQLARLEFGGQRIERRAIELDGLRERYLRLIWREPATAPSLSNATLEQSATRWQAAPIAWSAPVVPSHTARELKPGEYAYKLPVAMPINRLRIELPAGNVLLPMEVLQPSQDRRRWQSLQRGVVYRINNSGRDWSQNEITLSGGMIDEFVIRIDPRSNTLTQGPKLAYGLEPAQLIFLASGQAPFTLAVGNRQAGDVALPATTLIPGFGSGKTPDIGAASIQGTIVIASAPQQSVSAPAQPLADKPENWKKMALWGVLIAGVLGMAIMAWQLIRQMPAQGKGPNQQD
ncbi:DUF3999 domain-containing protein [Uliginosibacterium gangwonense]|uniref:DUF3999 domain-containing protein n=1 Tax=Uliginosibacterium gangwonense TaxID=392736 RepID=UPI00037BEE7F|nr:DUF3999 domain-containing protein [Uliginosibacterium gangwonense]